jgi:hypothetical protein
MVSGGTQEAKGGFEEQDTRRLLRSPLPVGCLISLVASVTLARGPYSH